MKITAIIVAGGKGTRMGAQINKVFLELCGKAVLEHTVEAFEENQNIDEIIVVTGSNDIEKATKILQNCNKLSAVVEGGEERQNSVYNGIKAASGDILVIHDAARALISQKEINDVIEDCKKYGAAALGVPCKDTLKSANENGFISGTIDRSVTYQIQTPQVFKTDLIRKLHQCAENDALSVTDDCAIAEHYGAAVKITAGSYDNIKLTTPEDMAVGEMILRRRK
ncbi:MAG: 2-C-methyl-D-erythritol 4-phosphate cytidylyltransferase [Clostridia bacterium]|nr:2-C-methyl-D-erythritol 4-phosphate cytidylyltransferase [Clostridia bacterium]